MFELPVTQVDAAPIFDDSNEGSKSGVDVSGDIGRRANLRSVILNSTLPKDVRTARIRYVHERVIDSTEILRLTDGAALRPGSPEQTDLLRARRTALSRYTGETLICVLIQLPGVIYTIEIDPLTETIAHWEWQST